MGIFSKISASKKHAQQLQTEKKQKEKAAAVPKPKYMHTPKHAYVDALNSTCGATPGNTRQNLREAAERRKSRMSRGSSYATLNDLHSVHSSSTQITTMSSWEARKAMAQREQLGKAATPVATAPVRRSYQSSPLASVEPSTAGPSTVSSYDKLDLASLTPSPLRRPLQKSPSSQKKSVTIQAPAHSSLEPSPTSPTFDDFPEPCSSPVGVAIQPSHDPEPMMMQPAHLPSKKSFTITDVEALADISPEKEAPNERKTAMEGSKKRFSSPFWKRRGVAVAVVAA